LRSLQATGAAMSATTAVICCWLLSGTAMLDMRCQSAHSGTACYC
jgi:hypothetical protein